MKTTTLSILLLLLLPLSVSAKPLSANAFCAAMEFLPDFINEKIYEKNTGRIIDTRINEEVERKGITPAMSVFFKHFVRTDEFKQLLLNQGELWCKRR